jgi:protein involved in polysaccharide export with SLBB domain
MLSRRGVFVLMACALTVAPGLVSARQPFANLPYAAWRDDEPLYRLYPGDEMDVTVPSAPELNKTVTVQPDGRITLPLIEPQMAAGRTVEQLQEELAVAYSSQLLRPDIQVTLRAQPLKVFVGGEVGKPGVYDLPGDMDALRAIIEAGSFTTTAQRSKVIIIRRASDGRPMMRMVDFNRPFHTVAHVDLVPLKRFDIIYVPRTGLATFADVMTDIRNSLPVSFGYSFGSAAVF